MTLGAADAQKARAADHDVMRQELWHASTET